MIATWLTPGIYSASITLSEQITGSTTVVPVTIYVASNANGVTLIPLQRNLTFNYQTNTTLNPQQTVSVNTSALAYTNFTATASTSWLRLASQSFSPTASSADSFAPGQFYVSVDPTGLSAGPYTGKITLSSPGVASVDIPVKFNISSAPVLNSAPSSVSLDTTTAMLSAAVTITSSAATLISAAVSPPWLSISPSSAITSTSGSLFTLTADPSRLPTGDFDGAVTLTASGGTPTLTIPVHLHTSSNGASVSALQVSPSALSFTAITGTDAGTQYITINDGQGLALPFTVAVLSTESWLRIDSLSGTTPAIGTVTVSKSMPAGSYTASLLVTELPNGDQKTVGVTYNVTGKTFSATPTALTFSQASFGVAFSPQKLQVTANSPSSFQITSKPNWLTISGNGPLATPASLTVSVVPSGMAPGDYQDTIVLSGPIVLQIPVSLSIAAPIAPTAVPLSLNFTYALGAPPPATQSIQLADATAPVTFTVATATATGIPWLFANPATGTTPGTVAVRLDPSQLVPGQQAGSITIAFQDPVNTTVTVPVTVVVSGSAVQIQSLLNAAAWAPTSLSPGEIVTIAGTGLGPATPVFASASSAGAYGTTLGGVTVLFDQLPAPLLSVQSNQINAIVPYALAGRTTAAVQVQSGPNYSIPITVNVTGAAPGLFTSGGSGRGEAAALNADSTVNSVLNPVKRGDVLVLYMTGEGQTDPPGQDGRVIASDLRTPLLPVTATIGGEAAAVLYAGSAPGLVSGLCQVNLQVPSSVSPGPQPVEVRVGGIATQHGVTVEVR
ncbi:MAG TPA: IPT/TIG domain-containing protein [Candidatus Limnocylindrales bacterium]|nr:IPT/TIG domain-containing protein [Candidatus Limnocylindrales bacterium]